MGSVLQMPADGVLQVRHRRLKPKYGIEYGVPLGSDGWTSFNNGWITGKPDMSTFWIMDSADPPNPRLSGIYRVETPYFDNAWAYGETWVFIHASNNGVGGSEVVPAVLNEPAFDRNVACPMYCPSTNELWWIATSLGTADGGYSVANGYAQILKGPADGPVQDSTLVWSDFNTTYNNIFSGGNVDYTLLKLQYDHVRDCMWAWIFNNDVTFIPPDVQTVSSVRNGGYVGLLKFSPGGSLLDTIVFDTWSGLLYGDDHGVPWDVGLQQYFTVGHDGLFWYTSWYQDDDPAVEWPADSEGNQARLMSYNPDTNTHTVHSPDKAWLAEAPGFVDGRLLLTRDVGSNLTEDFILYDPATGEEESLGFPGGLNDGSSSRRIRSFWTSSDQSTEFPGIIAIDVQGGGSANAFFRLLPGHYGLTVTSADIDFERPWLTTDTPIYDTDEGEVHEATYGPFREGDHVRLGLLLQREASGQDEPAAADLAISRRNNSVSDFCVDGETDSAYWVWDEESGEITILWSGYETFGFQPYDAAETIISLDARTIDTAVPAQILDNIVRVTTLEEVVPIPVVSPGPMEADGGNDGCPDDSQGLPFGDDPPFVSGYETGPNE